MASIYTNSTSLQNAFHIEFNKPLDDRMSHESIESFVINKSKPTACPLYKKAYVGMQVSVLSADKSAALLYICKDATPYIFQGNGKEGAADVTIETIGNYWTQMSGGEYKLVKLSTANDGMLATYKMQYKAPGKDSFADIVGGASIDIPKDYLLKEVHLCKASYSNGKYTETHKQGDSGFDDDTNILCIHFIWNTKDGTGEQSETYIPVKSIIDVDALLEHIDSSIKAINAHIDASLNAINTHIDSSYVSLDSSIASHIDASVNAINAHIDASIEEVNTHIDDSLSAINTHIDSSYISLDTSIASHIDASVNAINAHIEETVTEIYERIDSSWIELTNKNDASLSAINTHIDTLDSSINAIDSSLSEMDEVHAAAIIDLERRVAALESASTTV